MKRLWKTTSRRIGSTLVVVILALIGLTAPAAAAEQAPFTATGTAVATGTTHLSGGLTQVDGTLAGTATHLGNFTGTVTRIQDHQRLHHLVGLGRGQRDGQRVHCRQRAL